MRWDELFDDLEGRLLAEDRLDLQAEVADRTRRERALVGLQERLLSWVDGPAVRLRVAGVGTVTGQLCDVGSDWLLLVEHPDRPCLVTFAALRTLTLPGVKAAPVGAVARAFGLGAALRAVSRDRAAVEVVDVDGVAILGTIDAVGRDLLDLAEHPADLPRRPEHVVAVRTIPFAAVAAVRRRR